MPQKHKRSAYLDHAATTPTDPRVVEAMLPYFTEKYGNPSSLYSLGLEAKNVLLEARQKISKIFNCTPGEIIFTGGGTESDNLGIIGVARAIARKEKKVGHIITSTIEHHAVLHACAYLEKNEGWRVTRVPVDEDGFIDQVALAAALAEDTALVSIMYANNEIGTIEPLSEIAKVIRDFSKAHNNKKIYFHTDACQAAGALDLNVENLGVDLMTINGSKIYGPKGVGALFIRRGTPIEPLIHGGGQERNLRSGTENVSAIVGLATALELAQAEHEQENARLVILRDKLIAGVLKSIPKSRLNGHPTRRLPNNANVTLLDVEGEAMLLYLDEYGIQAATGSACDSATLDPSHVIVALGLPYEFAHGSLRFTLGKSTTEADIDYVLEVLPGVIEILRKVSPLNLELDPKHNSHAQIIHH